MTPAERLALQARIAASQHNTLAMLVTDLIGGAHRLMTVLQPGGSLPLPQDFKEEVAGQALWSFLVTLAAFATGDDEAARDALLQRWLAMFAHASAQLRAGTAEVMTRPATMQVVRTHDGGFSARVTAGQVDP